MWEGFQVGGSVSSDVETEVPRGPGPHCAKGVLRVYGWRGQTASAPLHLYLKRPGDARLTRRPAWPAGTAGFP